VVLRADTGVGTGPGASTVLRGAKAVAGQALMFAGPNRVARPVLVNGAAGAIVTVRGRPVSIMGFTVVGGRVVAIDTLADTERLARLELSAIDGP
jgi:hypothetical protein